MWEYNKNIAQGMLIIYVLEPFANESSHLGGSFPRPV